jgi:DNA-binding response OmpR family regulator
MTATTAGTQAEGDTTPPTQAGGARILIVEDDFGIASNLETFLSLRGFAVDAVYSGQAALHRCSVDRFDVILLDVGLPGLDGLTFLRRLRDELRAATPVLVLSARKELADKLAGFAHGADDYLTKPFALAEVEARVRALLSRSAGGSVVDPVLRFETVELDRERGEVRVAGHVVRLTPKATQLLELLLRKPGQLIRRAAIESALWPDAQPQADALRSQIHALRRALLEHGFDGIETVHGVGLRLVARECDGL